MSHDASTTDSNSVFDIPLTHLRSPMFATGFGGSANNDTEIGTFVGGLQHFVGDDANRWLCCLGDETLFADSQTAAPLDDDYELPAAAITGLWPVVLFGASGTGKTSLALTIINNAVQHRSRQQDKPHAASRNPICLSGSDFFRRYRSAIDTHAVAEFREQFHQCGGLVIDNIQQLEKKVTTQQVLVSLIDDLIQLGVPIVVTMDQSPLSSVQLSPKLASRLSGGLHLPTFAPGPAARLELIDHLCSIHAIELTPESRGWVVDRLPVSVPRMNHFFLQLKTELRSRNLPANAPLDVVALANIFQRDGAHRQQLTAMINELVAETFGYTPEQLKSKSRKQSVVMARGVAIWLLRSLLEISFLKIGAELGGRDHSTIMHAFKKIDHIVNSDDDPAMQKTILALRSQVNAKLAAMMTVNVQ